MEATWSEHGINMNLASSSHTHNVFSQRKEKYLGENIANLLFCRLSADGGLLSLFLCSSGLVVALIGVYQGKRKEYKDKVLQERLAVSIRRAIYVEMRKSCKKVRIYKAIPFFIDR